MYINETTNGKPLVDVVNETVFYVRSNGRREGPFASRAIAEAIIAGQVLDTQNTYQIEEVLTASGKQVLLG